MFKISLWPKIFNRLELPLYIVTFGAILRDGAKNLNFETFSPRKIRESRLPMDGFLLYLYFSRSQWWPNYKTTLYRLGTPIIRRARDVSNIVANQTRSIINYYRKSCTVLRSKGPRQPITGRHLSTDKG